MGADPWEDFETVWETSPLKYAHNAKTPTLETDASANEYGQAEPVLTNAIHLDKMPLANIHAYRFEAGKHTLLLPTGMALVLGFTDSAITTRNAALDGTDDAMDWLFY